MLLGVEHVVRQAFLLQQRREQLGVFDGRGAHQHRLPAPVTLLDVGKNGVVFLARGAEHLVLTVGPNHGAVGRDDHGFQAVDFLEFVGLGVGRSSHARELAVHAEVVLEGNRGERLVLGLDLHAFLGLDRLMQAV